MKIYVTEFIKSVSDNSKPTVLKSGFGDGFSLSLKEFLLHFYSIIIPCVLNKFQNHVGLKEFKLTITFKFS